MNKDALSKELWSITNLITGFVVLQTISFTYACTKSDFTDLINTYWTKLAIALILIIVTAVECAVVWWCSKKNTLLIVAGSSADREIMKKVFFQAGVGRMFIIILLLVPALMSLYARQLAGIPFNK
jgi:hypothetical protein